MAKKELDFIIKVNNQQIDLTKKSFKEFDTIIKQAKKDLQELPLSDPRYKVLNKEIKAAEVAWKATTKAASDFKDEMDNGDPKIKSYKAQILEATKELLKLEQQFGKTSQQYLDQQNKVKALRDEQEEFTRGTMKLDDALSNLPGPIGQVGQAMQSTEVVTQSAKSAFNSLIQTFPALKNAWVATGFGAIIVLIGLLVGAVMDAAKSFTPLQDAFAALKDSVGAIFNALKPVADFILKVFVGALKILSSVISGVASVFGGVNNGFAQMSLNLERTINRQKSVLDDYSSFLSAHYTELLNLQMKYNEKKKAISDDEKLNEEDKQRKIKEMNYLFLSEQDALKNKFDRELVAKDKTLTKEQKDAALLRIDNERYTQLESIKNNKQYQSDLLDLEIRASNGRKRRAKQLIDELKSLGDKGSDLEKERRQEAITGLEQSINDEDVIRKQFQTEKSQKQTQADNELNKLQRQFNRDNTDAIKERSNQVLELTTSLIKEEHARSLKASQDRLVILQEEHRKEIRDAELAGLTLTGLREKQAAEDKVAREEIRKAQIQVDAYNFQLKINDEDRNLRELLTKDKDYYQRKRDLVQIEYQKDYALADGNKDLLEEARTKEWESLLAIDKEELGNISSNLELEYQGMYQLTANAFNKMRDIENARFEESKRGNEQNYEYIEALTKQHQKNLIDIDNQESQYRLELEQRNADTRQMLFQGYFKEQRRVEQEKYDLDVKMAGDNIALKETLEKEHQKRMRDMKLAEVDSYLGYYSQLSSAILNFYSQQDKVNALSQQNEIDALKNTVATKEELAVAEDKVKEKYFYKNRDAQYAQAMISAFQAAISAYSSLAAIPVVGPALGAAAAAIALGFGIKQANLIKQQQYVSSFTMPSEKGGGKPDYGRNYGDGGMIEGPLHAGGGVMINAEGGEAVMTRGAVSMFGPMLSMMNQAGGGTSFSKGAMGQAGFDSPKDSSITSQPQIIKTYVVSNELTSEVQKQARLKSLSTL